MANRFAVANGNFNDTATWSTTAAGSPGASVPVAGDNAIANNRTVTITANATCDVVTNNTTYGGTAGGGFVLSNGVELNAIITSDGPSIVITDTVVLSGSNSATITASSIASDTGSSQNYATVRHSSSGTLTIVAGSITGGFNNVGQPLDCIIFSGSGILNVTANITGGGGANSGVGIRNSGTGSLSITGNLTGGTTSVAYAVINASTGSAEVTGNITATSTTIGLFNSSTATISVIGNCTATNGFHAVSSTNASSAVRASGSFIYSPNGTLPIYTPKFILNTTPSVAKTRYALNGTGTYVDMFTADNSLGQASPSDVRSGTVYASGNLTGTLAVPAAGSVALGVPVDNTTGTAVLTPAAIRTELATELARIDTTISSRLAPSGTLATVTTLTNAPDVPTEAEIAAAVWGAATKEITGGTVNTLTNAPSVPSASQIASQVRTELSTELGRLDATVSSRLASASYTAPANSDITAIKAKTDALNTDRLAQCSTVATTGAQIAAALS